MPLGAGRRPGLTLAPRYGNLIYPDVITGVPTGSAESRMAPLRRLADRGLDTLPSGFPLIDVQARPAPEVTAVTINSANVPAMTLPGGTGDSDLLSVVLCDDVRRGSHGREP
jgi:hypothetical protein